MIKGIKKMFAFGAFSLILPLCVKADYSVSLNCAKDTIAPGESVTCSMDANVGEASASGFSTKFSVGDNLEYVSFNKNSFFDAGGSVSQLDGTDSYIITMNNSDGEGKTGEFKIGDLVIKAKSQSGESVISFDDSKFAIDVPGNTVTEFITIGSKTITISADAASSASTGDSSNTGSTNSGSSESTSKKGDGITSPKTGVKVSVLSFAVLAIGSGAYVVLKKKNYFNKI